MVLRHMSAAKMDTNSSGLLIRQLILRKNSNGYVLGNKGISYSRCQEIFLDALAALGYDPKLFGLHSLRSGGATAAVNSLGGTVSDRLLTTFRLLYEDDYEYDFSVLSTPCRFGGRKISKCACSELKTRTRSRSRTPI